MTKETKKPKAEAAPAKPNVAPETVSTVVEAIEKPTESKPAAADPAERKSVELGFPLPADVPDEVLNGAILIVRAKAERGFRRGGFAFTREPTEIPLADLSAEQLVAIGKESQLSVTVRLVAPAKD
jgi:hypothetical protein